MQTRSSRNKKSTSPKDDVAVHVLEENEAPIEAKIKRPIEIEAEKTQLESSSLENVEWESQEIIINDIGKSKRKRSRKKKEQKQTISEGKNSLTLSPPTSTDTFSTNTTNGKNSLDNLDAKNLSNIEEKEESGRGSENSEIGNNELDDELMELDDYDLALEEALQQANNKSEKEFKSKNLNSPKIRKRKNISKNSYSSNNSKNNKNVILINNQDKIYQKIMKRSKTFKEARNLNNFKFSVNEKSKSGESERSGNNNNTNNFKNLSRFRENMTKSLNR